MIAVPQNLYQLDKRREYSQAGQFMGVNKILLFYCVGTVPGYSEQYYFLARVDK